MRDRRVDVRLIAATHQDLEALVRERRFRSDLLFRINALPLMVPSLRERREDIPTLARRLLARLAADLGRGSTSLAPDATEALLEYPWPGNIRELRNVLERAALLSESAVLSARDLRLRTESGARGEPPDESLTLAELERRQIERVLRAEKGNVGRSAERLGIPRSSLYQKLGKLGIIPSKV